jgi:serine/threonine protein phosphatase PrpC
MKRATMRYKQVDAEIGRQAAEDPKLMGMGTTMTAAYSIGADLFVIHVGDSRAYLLRDGRLHQLTRDQTLVQTLVDLGELTPEGASSHPLRHVLTHAWDSIMAESTSKLSVSSCGMAIVCWSVRMV